MSSGSGALEFKHHVVNGRLAQAQRLLAASKLSLEDIDDEDGNSPMHWCAQGLQVQTDKREATDVEIFVFLLKNSAPQNRRNCLGETPLMSTMRLATLEPVRAEALVMEMLTKGQADPCRADLTGETPLMESAAADLEGIGRLLLEHRANPLATSDNGLTAAKLAEDSNASAFAQLLKSPLAVRAAREAQQEEVETADADERERLGEVRREQHAKKFGQKLFGQKLSPGLAKDRDAPGKPYPEYGSLHDID